MSSRTFAGPFLRYDNCMPGSKVWKGSVLFLTKTEEGAQEVRGDANAAVAIPTIEIEDGGKASTQVSEAKWLDSCFGWHFWRFDIELELENEQRPVRYVVTPPSGSSGEQQSATFFVPGENQSWHWGYTSCNGISHDIAEDAPARQDPTYLWRDLLKVHSAFPMHCLVGGGDQVYNDGVWRECEGLVAWGDIEEYEDKLSAEWTQELETQASRFYLNNYIDCYMTDHVSTAMASIPNVMMWDDHDIFDGYGSYDKELQTCPVFKGIFEVAKRFFLLFQQHATVESAAKSDEWMDISEGYHSVRYLGSDVALLNIDMRTRRTKENILPDSSYQIIRSAMMDLPDGIEHVVALSGVPVCFPSIPMSEAILGSMKAMMKKFTTCRNLGKSFNILDRFEQPEILDDLLDGWAAKVHAEEKVKFIHMLQEAADAKKYRITILSGDAHVGGVGRLYSKPKKALKDDPHFMPQIISSAVMNAPPPSGVVKMLMRTNFAINIDSKTKQKMVKAFWPYHPRTDKLIGLRNWCDVAPLKAPYAAPGNPEDPDFGGLRFSLRVENPNHRRGYAEEVYDVIVPRYPTDAAISS